MTLDKAREISKLGALLLLLGALLHAPWIDTGWRAVPILGVGVSLLLSMIGTVFEDDECDCECTCDDATEVEAK